MSERHQPSYHYRNRRVVIPDGVMAIGVIVGAHGLGGEVKIEVHTDYPERFAEGNTILMGVELLATRIAASRPHKNLQLVRFHGIGNRSEAENLRGQWLFIADEDAAALEDDVYWIHDLVGMEVRDTAGRVLGTVHNVLQTGANDVYLIAPAEGINRGREILLPAIADVVQRVDPTHRLIVVDLMPGLLEEEGEDD